MRIVQFREAIAEAMTEEMRADERVFLMGEEQGVVSIKIDYKDKSTQYLQSHCSDATYVIEQL